MEPIVITDSRLEAVTVFPDRARVTRQARTTLTAGLHILEFPELPLGLQTESLRVAGHGTARARLLGASARLVHYVDTPVEAVRTLETSLAAAEEVSQDLAAQAGVLEREQQHLDDLGAQAETFARGLALRGQKPEEQGAMFDFWRARSVALQRDRLRLAREKRENDKRVEQLKQQLQAARTARPRQRYNVAVEVEAQAPGDLTVALTYLVTGAAWRALYDVRLEGEALAVTYLAEVTQTTGEDWPAVELALSTAQPALALTVPELEPWYVRVPPPPMPRQAAAPQAKMATRAAGLAEHADLALLQPAAAPAAAPPLELELPAAEVAEAGAALTYRLAGRADVPGNGEPRKVTVAAFPLKPALDYVTAPKLTAACYRRATVKNDSPYTLLAGRAQLFEGEEYLGATDLELAPPGREFELFLGADERVRVERELTTRDVDKTLIGDKRRTRFGYKIKLENLRDQPQKVLVRDQLPVARDEQVKIRLESAEPRPGEHSDLNLLEWACTVPAGGQQTLRFEFTVEHPRALPVLGLP